MQEPGSGSAAVTVTGRDRQREKTRQRVRDCALEVFRRDGLAAAKIDDIVRAARVSRGTFYFHFPAKEDVVMEVLREAEHRIAAAIAKLPAETSLERVLRVTCEKIADEWEGEPRLFQEVGGVAVRRAVETFPEGERDPVSQALADGFRAAVARGELTEFLPAEVLADFFLINAFAAALSWCAHPKTPLRVVFASVVGIFLHGARAQLLAAKAARGAAGAAGSRAGSRTSRVSRESSRESGDASGASGASRGRGSSRAASAASVRGARGDSGRG
jgi:AcrR family transcriptional regulator